MKINDKTDADKIYSIFAMSKKNFKKAIGKLYKERKIFIHDDGIQLT
jgi:hypothetical protein